MHLGPERELDSHDWEDDNRGKSRSSISTEYDTARTEQISACRQLVAGDCRLAHPSPLLLLLTAGALWVGAIKDRVPAAAAIGQD